MLYALNQQKKLISATKSEKTEGPFFCFECNEELVLRKGDIREHHFSHKNNSVCIMNNIDGFGTVGGGESLEHYNLKMNLKSYLDTRKDCANVQCEKYLKTEDSKRFADVFCELHRNGEIYPICFEIQESDLPIATLKERTLDYTKKGYYTFWLLTENAIDSQKEWLNKLRGFNGSHLFYYLGDGIILDRRLPGNNEVRREELNLIDDIQFRDNHVVRGVRYQILHSNMDYQEPRKM
jgi:competence CoiA-like predicted nuclease